MSALRLREIGIHKVLLKLELYGRRFVDCISKNKDLRLCLFKDET